MASQNEKLKLLIVDDSYPNRMLLSDAFNKEFEVLAASDGEEAMKFLEEETDIAAVLLDLVMPGMDGFAVITRMHKSPELSRIPVIAIAKAENVDNQMRALDMGAVDVITKPFNLQLVLHRVRSIIIRSTFLSSEDMTKMYDRMFEHNDIDERTGIFHRRAFCNWTRDLLDANPHDQFVIFRWDIDDFKVLNDVYGVGEGDRFLSEVGARYIDYAVPKMTYGHWEADSFVSCMLLDDFNARKVPEIIEKECAAANFEFDIVPRIGVYIVDDMGIDVSLMCDRALLALKSIKGNYSQRVAFYDESMRSNLLESKQIASEMEGALRDGQFVIYLQPQYNYSTGRLHGAEALVRWQHPVKGLIPPNKFIPVFEKNGFITKLDEYVWEEACRLERKWLDQGYRVMPISVNVSRTDVCGMRVVECFTRLVEKYHLPASCIRIEITETAYMDNPGQLIGIVERLRAAGFPVEMDDFGSGYSSLNTLKEVPVDLLKLDMKFIQAGTNEERGGSILSSVVRMANWLQLPVLAEGVETKEQADFLKSIGCVYMQGYFFSRPVPVNDFEKIMLEGEIETEEHKITSIGDNPYEFLNASMQNAMLFNCFVGGAAIVEYCGGNIEALRMNDMFFKTIQTTREDFEPYMKSLMQVLDTENKTIMRSAFETSIGTNAESACELCINKFNGSNMWLRMRLRPLAENADRYLFYMSVDNISQKMNLLTKNIELSRKLSYLLNNLPAGVVDYVYTDKLRLDYFSERYPMMFGYSGEEYRNLFGDDPLITIHPGDRDKIVAAIRPISTGEISETDLKYRHICSNGEYKWVHLFIRVVEIEGSKRISNGIIFDIDDRTREEEEAREQRRKYSSHRKLMTELFNALECGIAIFRLQGRTFSLVEYNSAAWKILGYGSDADFVQNVRFIDDDPAKLCTNEGVPILDIASKLRDNPTDYSTEYSLKLHNVDGASIGVRCNMIYIEGDNGEAYYEFLFKPEKAMLY